MLRGRVHRAVVMSDANLATIRRIYDGWSKGDFREVDFFDPDVVFVMRPQFPDAGTYIGLERVAEYMRGFLEPWTEITITAEEIHDAGDGVAVGIVQRGAGSGSGALTDFRYFQVWTFRGGKAIRFETVRERAEALELAGVRE
jgi:ketosteroid isomerase-like protein